MELLRPQVITTLAACQKEQKEYPVADNLHEQRADDYADKGWIVNLAKHSFNKIPQLYKKREQYPFPLPQQDFNETLDTPGDGKPITLQIVHNGRRLVSERFGNSEFNLWKIGNLAVYDGNEMHYVHETPQGDKILDAIEKAGSTLQVERLSANGATPEEKELARLYGKVKFAAMLKETNDLPNPIPETGFVLLYAHDNWATPQEHFDFFGDDLEIITRLQAFSMDPVTKLLRLDNLIAIRFNTHTYIANTQQMLAEADMLRHEPNLCDYLGYSEKRDRIVHLAQFERMHTPPEVTYPSAA